MTSRNGGIRLRVAVVVSLAAISLFVPVTSHSVDLGKAANERSSRAVSQPMPRIAFACVKNKNTDIYDRLLSGGTIHRLTTAPHQDTEPAWSPSRHSLAFTSYRRDGNPDIWVMGANGGSVHNLTPQRGSQSMAASSPDGTQIAYASVGPGVSKDGLWIMNSNGSNKQYVPHTGLGFSPSWSADGMRIVFATAASGYALFTIAPDGSSRTQITHPIGTREDFDPVWSPDGSWIAFTQNSGIRAASPTRSLSVAVAEVYVVRPSGRGLRRVSYDHALASGPDWSNNSNRLVYEQSPPIGATAVHPGRGIRIVHLRSRRSHWFLRGDCSDPNWG